MNIVLYKKASCFGIVLNIPPQAYAAGKEAVKKFLSNSLWLIFL